VVVVVVVVVVVAVVVVLILESLFCVYCPLEQPGLL